MKYSPGLVPQNTKVSQWFTQYIAPYLAKELQKVADALGIGQRVVSIDPFEVAGLTGRPDADESAQYQALLDKIPDRTLAMIPSLDFRTRITKSIALRGKTGSALIAPSIRPFDSRKNYDPGNQLIWDGSKGESIFRIEDSGHLTLGGFAVHSGNAGVSIDIDQTQRAPRIMTASMLERMLLTTDDPYNRDWIAIRISHNSGDNVEYMDFRHVQIVGSRYGWPPVFGTDATISLDEPDVVRFASAPTIMKDGKRVPGMDHWEAERFLIAGAGPPLSIGNVLDAKVLAVIDPQTIRLDRPALQAVTGARWQAREWLGCGIDNRSQNSKRHYGDTVNFAGLDTAIRSMGGSIHMHKPNFAGNGVNWLLGNLQSETSSENIANSENSGMHIVYDRAAGSMPFTSREPRLALQNVTPGCGYITCKSANLIRFIGGSLEGDIPDGSHVVDLTQYAGMTIKFEGTDIPWNYDERRFGCARDQIPGRHCRVIFDDCRGSGGGNVVKSVYVEYGDWSRELVRSYNGRLHMPAPTAEQRKLNQLKPGQVTFEHDPRTGKLIAIMRGEDDALYTGAIDLTPLTLPSTSEKQQ